MSKFNRNILALALATAFLSPAALAYDLTTDGDADPEEVAVQIGPDFTMTEDVEISTELGDNLIGRSVGFQVRITLLDGAEFGAVAPAITVGTALTTSGSGWTTSLAAGGVQGGTIAAFSIEPVDATSTIVDGIIGAIALDLESVASTPGATTRARIELIDPVSSSPISDLPNGITDVIIVRTDGLAFTCDEQPNVNRIDVGGNVTFDPKTGFVLSTTVPPYAIGGASTDLAALGEIAVATTGGFVLDVGAGGDSLYSRVTGTDLSAFDDIFLGDATCATNYASYTINTTTNVAVLDEEFATLIGAGAPFGANGGAATLCVDVDGTTVVEAQQFAVSNGLNGAAEADACVVSPIEYNGSLVNVFYLTPAANMETEGFVRVINDSNIAGRVSIRGKRDNDGGAFAPGTVSFDLDAGQAVVYTMAELESGTEFAGRPNLTGALGAGAGRWYLEVTGEFDDMIVQGFGRSRGTNVLSNTTPADTSVSQDAEGKK